MNINSVFTFDPSKPLFNLYPIAKTHFLDLKMGGNGGEEINADVGSSSNILKIRSSDVVLKQNGRIDKKLSIFVGTSSPFSYLYKIQFLENIDSWRSEFTQKIQNLPNSIPLDA